MTQVWLACLIKRAVCVSWNSLASEVSLASTVDTAHVYSVKMFVTVSGTERMPCLPVLYALTQGFKP